MFSLKSSETTDLTRDVLATFRALPPSPTERDLSEARVEHLDHKREDGLLVTFGWSIAELGGQRYRMNGQHSAEMLARLNGEFPDGLKVHIDEYHVDDEASLADLFRQFDDRKSGRSPADVSGAYQMLQENLRPVPKPSAKLAVEGVSWFRRNIEGVPVGAGDDQYVLFNVEGLHGFIQWVGKVFSIKTPELMRVPVTAAMYATFIKSETAASTFWNDVARGGVEFEDDHPTTKLDAWLKESKEKADSSKPKRKVKPGEFYQGCIYAWNAFRDSKTLPGAPGKAIRYDIGKGFHDVAD